MGGRGRRAHPHGRSRRRTTSPCSRHNITPGVRRGGVRVPARCRPAASSSMAAMAPSTSDAFPSRPSPPASPTTPRTENKESDQDRRHPVADGREALDLKKDQWYIRQVRLEGAIKIYARSWMARNSWVRPRFSPPSAAAGGSPPPAPTSATCGSVKARHERSAHVSRTQRCRSGAVDRGGLGRLRISVFREYPYLYDGTLEYEREYLKTYVRSPGEPCRACDGRRRTRSWARPLCDPAA